MITKPDKFLRHFRLQGPVVLLESQSPNHPAADRTYLAACPEATIKTWEDNIEIKTNGELTTFAGNPWRALQSFRETWGDWLFGYLGYDLKNYTEALTSKNNDKLKAPDMFFMVPGVVLEFDRLQEHVQAIKGTLPQLGAYGEDREAIEIKQLHSTVSRESYIACIEQAKQQIYEGTYYEINLSHQLQAEFKGDSFKLYREMRNKGPVPFGSFIEFDDVAVCSLSPERFLRKKGKTVFSQPIKGTMKRSPNQKTDDNLKKRLVESVKERAENLMIVDLVRNDLSRIARPGTVEVPRLFEIQTFDTVHQMVSTVQGETQVTDPVEIVKACYPMGSMTGAPKISAMQWIEKLEAYRRGIYSGAIGYITPEGNFDFSVVIRTAIIQQGTLFYSVGGAITSDSEPQSEWEETLLKARALTTSLDC